ncbi:MAG: RNase adapter RapZ [Bacillota bacterium]
MDKNRFVIITGMSGAGKSVVAKFFEDFGYFCVDNLPPALLAKLAELCVQAGGNIAKAALVIDIRGGRFFDEVFKALETLEENGFQFEILFLEARDEVLVRRYKFTRRRHPLSKSGSILQGIHAEREKLVDLREKASRIIDTSELTNQDLKNVLAKHYAQDADDARIVINIMSFGFKYGIPLDADLVFDVRFLPNPFYIDALKDKTGSEKEVSDYVMKWPVANRFFNKLTEMIEFLLPYYIKEGKNSLIITIGCTGGKHRSVVLGMKLGDYLRRKGYRTSVEHRDINL